MAASLQKREAKRQTKQSTKRTNWGSRVRKVGRVVGREIGKLSLPRRAKEFGFGVARQIRGLSLGRRINQLSLGRRAKQLGHEFGRLSVGRRAKELGYEFGRRALQVGKKGFEFLSHGVRVFAEWLAGWIAQQLPSWMQIVRLTFDMFVALIRIIVQLIAQLIMDRLVLSTLVLSTLRVGGDASGGASRQNLGWFSRLRDKFASFWVVNAVSDFIIWRVYPLYSALTFTVRRFPRTQKLTGMAAGITAALYYVFGSTAATIFAAAIVASLAGLARLGVEKAIFYAVKQFEKEMANQPASFPPELVQRYRMVLTHIWDDVFAFWKAAERNKSILQALHEQMPGLRDVPATACWHVTTKHERESATKRGRVERWDEMRDYAILPIPPNLKENIMRKAVHGYGGVAKGTKITGQFYYRSTGTSTNAEQYPGVWFPAFGVAEDSFIGPRGKPVIAWIQKAGLYPPDRPAKWQQSYCQQMGKPWQECAQDPVVKLFKRFGRWFHVQQSAALGGGIWEKDAKFYRLRVFALSFSFNPKTEKFYKDPSIVQFYVVKEPCHKRTWSNQESAKLLNDELAKYHALFTRLYDQPTSPTQETKLAR